MEKNTNRPSKGIMQDVNPIDQPKETYRYALNAVNENNTGNRGILSNEKSNEECFTLPGTLQPIGKVYTKDANVVIFSTDGVNSEIGISRNCVYTTLVNSQCLGFNKQYQIDATYRLRRGCETVIYFTDGLNPPRQVNLNKLENYYSDAYITYLETPVPPFVGEKWNCEKFKLIAGFDVPCFSSAEILTGGSLKAGSYNFAIQLLDEGLNPTPWIVTSHTINIYHDDISAAFNSITGSSQLEGDGAGGRLNPTNKSIKLTITNLDPDFFYYRIAIIEATGFTGNVTKTVVSPEQVISDDFDIFVFDGGLNGYTEISSEEIKLGKIDIETAKHVEQLENRLLLANTKGKQVNFCGFQAFASAIHSRYIVKEVSATDASALGNPKNPLTPFECMGFMGGEVYALGIVYVFEDGFESPVYHIPGPPPDQRYNWTTELCEVVDDTSVVAVWNNDIEHIVPATDAAAYNALPDADKVEKWRVYETALQVNATEGQMAYWQCSQSQYEAKQDCSGGDYWGTDICGNDLVGTPIRHHRFPSRTLEPHVDNDGSLSSYYNLVITIVLNLGQVWPVGVPTIDLDVTYSYNGVVQPVITLNLLETDFVTGSYTTIIDTQIGDALSFDTVSFSGTMVTTYPTIFLPTYSVEYAYQKFVDNTTLRLLGLKFTNVIYPHPDIVGHYFVRAERDSFNRTILDSGVSNRMREESLKLDYITFGYFTRNETSSPALGVSDDHHYLFTPKFCYNRDSLNPTYIKAELEFDYASQYLHKKKYDGVGWFAVDVDTVVELRNQNYINNTGANSGTNHNVAKMISVDALAYDDTYELGNRLYNLSYTNRIQVTKLGQPLPRNGQDMPYVTLRVERDVHCNLDSITYYKMHNCMIVGDIESEIFAGDVYITPFNLSNTLLREVFSGIVTGFLLALATIAIATGVVLTLGAGAVPAIGLTTALYLSAAAVFAGVVGAGAFAASTLIRAYSESQLDKMSADDDLDALTSSWDSTMNYANEHLEGVYVESEVNCSLKQARTDMCGEFYNNQRDIEEYFRDRILYYDADKKKWMPKGTVCPEVYHWNKDFNRMDKQKVYFPLPTSYDCCSDCLETFPDRVYYSEQSFQEELSDNYKAFLPNNYRDIEAEHGGITGMIRKGNTLFILTEECLWQLPQNLQQSTVNEIVTFIGTGDFFSVPPRKVIDSDLGTAGTRHKWSILKSPLGVFYVSEIEKAIYLVSSAEGGMKKVSNEGMYNWFSEYLQPYLGEQFLSITGEVFPNLDNPNNTNGVGIHSAYDPRHQRVLFTKRDYKIVPSQVAGFEIITQPYAGLTTGQLYYNATENKFVVAVSAVNANVVLFSNPLYFENKSFTISYSLLTQSWISFHSYIPLFYYFDQKTFYSTTTGKIWKHNIQGSYQRFYNILYSHIIEYVSVSNPMNTRLWEDITLQTVARKYDSIADEYLDEKNTTFNYLTVYNSRQISGELQMLVKDIQADPEDYFQQQTVNTTNTIVIDRKERDWHINDFRDMRTDYTIPMFTKDWVAVSSIYPIDKVINPTVTSTSKEWYDQESFRDKYLIIRLRFSNFDDVELSTNFTIETEQNSFR